MWRSGSRSIACTVSPLTGEVEEPSKLCGKFCWRWKDSMAEEEDQGALALIPDLAKALEWVSLPVVCLGNALQLPKEDLAGAVRVL